MTNLIRFSPSNGLHHLEREMDRIFESYLGKGNGDNESAVWKPRVDLAESEGAYHIHVEVPGIPKDQIEINYHNHVLTVSGERTSTAENESKTFVRIERSYGRFYRSFNLPEAADTDQIEAEYHDGVLDIRVPKAEDRKPRRIEVR